MVDETPVVGRPTRSAGYAMNDIRTVLRTAARRMGMNLFLDRAHIVALVIASIALVLMIADRTTAAPFVPWLWVAPLLAGLAGLAALIWWARRRPSEFQVALAVDDRLDLRERMSTALHCQGRDDSFAQAAMEDAVTVARDARTQDQVRRRFAVNPPRRWWISPLLIAATVLVSLLPQFNLFAREPENAEELDAARHDSQQAIEVVTKAIEESPELKNELGDLLDQPTQEGTDMTPLRPEEIKRDALKKVTDLQKRLDELLHGEKGKTADALEKALEQLKLPDNGAGKKLAEELAKGNFQGAMKAMEEIQKQLEKGELSEQQKEQLAEQLQNMAEQLNQLAQQQNQLAQALKQAGLDPQLAQNPQALQQALQNNPNLNQQQQQQIQQMAQAQQAAQQMCQGMGQAMGQMAQGLQQGQMGQFQQGNQQMGQMLNDMEAMQQMLQQAQAAANACQGQCQGLGQGLNQQMAQQPGGAFGGPGIGAGGKAPVAPTPTKTKIEQAKSNTTSGDIIARIYVQGENFKGEAKKKLTPAQLSEHIEGFDEAVLEDQLPRKYHEAQKHYFGDQLPKRVGTPPPSAEPAEPAEPKDGQTAEGESGDSGTSDDGSSPP